MNIRGVIIGAGYFAQFHAEAWKRIEGVTIVAVADSIPGRAEQFAARFAIPGAYESAGEMLRVEKPGFADIATRPDTHLELTRRAAGSGTQVICQKPMSPTVADSLAMCQACEAAGVRLLIHENWRWQPWYREVKRMLAANALGEMTRLTFDWRTGDGVGPQPYASQPYFRLMPRLLIFESLVHILDTFRRPSHSALGRAGLDAMHSGVLGLPPSLAGHGKHETALALPHRAVGSAAGGVVRIR